MRSADSGAGRGLIGRVAERAAVAELVAAAERGRGALLLISGEPGIGKTRLLQEAVERAREAGLRTLASRCSEAEGAPPYWPWTQMLRSVLEAPSPAVSDALRSRRPALAPVLPELLADGPPGAARHEEAPESRFRLFEAVIAVLRAAAREAPLLVVLDDLHRADVDSLLLLRQLGGELTGSRIGVMGSLRFGESGPEAQRLLEEIGAGGGLLSLGGLTPEEVASWLESAAGRPAPAALCRKLHERTGGNPLFLEETLRLLRSEGEGAPISLGALERAPVPPSVRQLILRRVERLPAPTREVLARASVLGREFELEPLARLAERPVAEVLDAMDPALEARLLQPVAGASGRFAFAHVLARDALYEDLSIRERLSLHRRAADALEELAPAGAEQRRAQIAQHLLASAPLGDLARTLDAAIAAGREARGRLALDHAASYYRQALATLEATPAARLPDLERRRCELRLALGDALWQAGAASESRSVYLRAAEDARALADAKLLARAAIGAIGRDDAPIDPPPASVALMEEAVRSLPAEPDPLRARLLSASAHVLSYALPPRRAEAEAEAREAVAIAERLGDAQTRLFALLGLHHALWTAERLRERLALSEELVRAAPVVGSRRAEIICRHWRAVDLLEAGDVAGAREEIRRHERLAGELHQPLFDWLQAALRAMLTLLEGRLADAEARISEAFSLGRRAGSPNALALFGDQLLHLREHQHRLGELEALIQQVIQGNPAIRAFEIGLPLIQVDTLQLDQARHAFDRLAAKGFDDFPRDGQWLAFLHATVRVCAALEDRPRAAQLLELLEPFEGQCIVSGHGTYWAGSAARYVGLLRRTLGDAPGAARSFEQAIEVHRGAGARCLLAHTLREYAELLLSEGRRAPARSLAEEALQLYRDVGTEGWAAVSEALLRELPGASARAKASEGRLVCEGSDWLVEFQGAQAHVAGGKGMRDLALLLEAPDRPIHALELASGPAADGEPPAGDPDLVARGSEHRDAAADPQARAAYRVRLAELREELAEAERRHDLGARERLQEELDWIEDALGRSDWLAPDRGSRARKAVYNRLQAAIRRIDVRLPALGRHLRNSIRTGTTCVYSPESPVRWIVRRPRSE